MTSSVQIPAPSPAEHPAAGGGAARVEPAARELAALAALASGLTAEAAARGMGASARTLRRAQREAADRFGVSTPVQALVLAVSAGLIDVERARAGQLPDWPFPPGQYQDVKAGKRARFWHLRTAGIPVEVAADEVGVLPGIAWGWDQQWREARCGGGGG